MLDTIYIARHGFRMAWRGNELNLSPTGRPRDPVLTAHGVDQVERLGDYFEGLPEDKRPQMIISSPYYRCVQTSGPTAKKLQKPIHIEPGIAEWFPTSKKDTGHQPIPMRASTASRFSPNVTSIAEWSPLVYPLRTGESIQQLHSRARRVLGLIEERCKELGISRVLLVSHAATIIAMGRVLLEPADEETTNWDTGDGIEIGAGTASLSLYIRGAEARSAHGVDVKTDSAMMRRPWYQVMNGSCEHLTHGVEREWTFHDIPGNVEEEGMGIGYKDEESLDEEEMLRLEQAAVVIKDSKSSNDTQTSATTRAKI